MLALQRGGHLILPPVPGKPGALGQGPGVSQLWADMGEESWVPKQTWFGGCACTGPLQNFGAPSFDDKKLEVVAVFGSIQMAVSRVINLQHHRIAQVGERDPVLESCWGTCRSGAAQLSPWALAPTRVAESSQLRCQPLSLIHI